MQFHIGNHQRKTEKLKKMDLESILCEFYVIQGNSFDPHKHLLLVFVLLT